MTSIAFLGLGRMGSPLAGRLIGAGHDVTVWNRTSSKAEALRLLGAAVAATPADAVRDAEFVVVMLADGPAVDAVLADLAKALRPGAVVVDMSTVGQDTVRKSRETLPKGIGLVVAPVLGSVDRAATGELILFVGGTDEDVAEVQPILDLFGTTNRCGALGTGSAMKLVLINAVIAGVTVVGEALALADKLGVADARTALANSPVGGLVGRAFATGVDFPIHLAAKDLRLAGEVVGLPLFTAAEKVLSSAPYQDDDLAKVVDHIREQ